MNKKLHSKYQYVGSKKVFILEKNDIFVLDALMHDGSQQKYSKKQQKLKYSEHGGLLDFDSHGLEKIIISTKKESDKSDPEIYFPIVSDDVEDYEFMYHTHPPTPTPGARASIGIVYEIPSLTDIHTFILIYMEGKTQGSIIIAPEGIYVIRALKDKLHVNNYNLDKMYDEIMYLNYEYAEKYNFNITPVIFYNKIITDTRLPKKIKTLVEKYTNNELTIDFFRRKLDKNKNWTINKIALIVRPKEKKYN